MAEKHSAILMDPGSVRATMPLRIEHALERHSLRIPEGTPRSDHSGDTTHG